MAPMLTLIRGLPGSGKSTLARELPGVHLEADMYFSRTGEYRFNPADLPAAHDWCQRETVTHLLEGRNVNVSNTFSRLWEMQPYLDIAKVLGIRIRVVECQGNYGNIHNVPERVIADMKNRWEAYYG